MSSSFFFLFFEIFYMVKTICGHQQVHNVGISRSEIHNVYSMALQGCGGDDKLTVVKLDLLSLEREILV